MTDDSRRSPRLWPLVAAAVVLGLIVGAGAVYVKETAKGNSQTASATCTPRPELIAALKPLAKGEVAAVIIPDAPRPLPALDFLKDGKPVSLKDFAGRTVLLNIWATWCAPCRHEMPALDTLQTALGGERFEVVPISVDLNGKEKARKFLAEVNATALGHYTEPSGKLLDALKGVGRAVGLPTSILVDADGCEVGYLPGPAEWASEDAQALIRAAMPAMGQKADGTKS
jgi:thiol-disulfide isomerase/thioredoxin